MSGETKKKAREAAERWTPSAASERDRIVNAFVAGYMAGHAAQVRWANKMVLEYREAKAAQSSVNGDGNGR